MTHVQMRHIILESECACIVHELTIHNQCWYNLNFCIKYLALPSCSHLTSRQSSPTSMPTAARGSISFHFVPTPIAVPVERSSVCACCFCTLLSTLTSIDLMMLSSLSFCSVT